MNERSGKTSGDRAKVVRLRPDGRRRRACPICGADAVHRYRPFCSKRCADIDLGRWLKGGYAIPTEEAPLPGGETDAAGRTPDGRGDDED